MKGIRSIIASLREEYRKIQAGMCEAIMPTRKPHAGVREAIISTRKPHAGVHELCMIKIQLLRNQYFMNHDSFYRADNCKINAVG